jgi:hypothetical protein
MDVTPQGLKLVELAPGVTREELQSKTGVFGLPYCPRRSRPLGCATPA